MVEDNHAIYIKADLPGIKEDNITVDLSQQHVLIMGTRKHRSLNGLTIYLEELASGPVARILSLPCPIDTSQAKAEFQDGVLELTLPKFMPEAKRRITFGEARTGKDASSKKHEVRTKGNGKR